MAPRRNRMVGQASACTTGDFMNPVIIVGGGISGLAASYDLRRAGVEHLVIDSAARLGGVIRTQSIEGNTLECGPDSFISQKPAVLQLIGELGMKDDVIGSNDDRRITYIQRNGKLMALPDGLMMMVPTKILPMAVSPLLSWGTKIRMGLEYFRKPSAVARGDRSVAEFINDHYGQEAVDYLAEPLLAGVYGGDPTQLSVGSVLPRFVDLESKYGSLTRGVLAHKAKANAPSGSLFRTLKQGLGELVKKLTPPPASVMLNSVASGLERVGNNRFRVRVNEQWMDARAVILTGPAYQAARLIADLDPALALQLNQIEYGSSAIANLGYKTSRMPKPLVGFGLLVPGKERKRMRACTFVGNKFSFRVAEGWQVIRCFFGGMADGAILGESDEMIRAHAIEELRAILGISVDPDFCEISRWPRSMAQYTVGHGSRIEAIQARMKTLPGVFLAGNGYQGIGLPDCVQMGRAAAKAAIELK